MWPHLLFVYRAASCSPSFFSFPPSPSPLVLLCFCFCIFMTVFFVSGALSYSLLLFVFQIWFPRLVCCILSLSVVPSLPILDSVAIFVLFLVVVSFVPSSTLYMYKAFSSWFGCRAFVLTLLVLVGCVHGSCAVPARGAFVPTRIQRLFGSCCNLDHTRILQFLRAAKVS